MCEERMLRIVCYGRHRRSSPRTRTTTGRRRKRVMARTNYYSCYAVSHAPAPDLHGLWRSPPPLSFSLLRSCISFSRAYSLADLQYIMFRHQNYNRPAEISIRCMSKAETPDTAVLSIPRADASAKQRGRYVCTIAPLDLCQYSRWSTQ